MLLVLMLSAAVAASAAAAAPEQSAGPEASRPAEVPFLADTSAAAAISPESPGSATSPDSLESFQLGRKLVLDWTVAEATPARFRILHPDGRVIATRYGRRSVQGWIASVRVAGWPRGLYLVTAEAGAMKSAGKFILR